jgi:hypothetical protein
MKAEVDISYSCCQPGYYYYNDNDGTYIRCENKAEALEWVRDMGHDHQVILVDNSGKQTFLTDGTTQENR